MIITEYNEEWDNDAKRRYYEQNFMQGFLQGFIQGFIQGFMQGFERGRKEEELRVVKNLLAVKTPIEFIVKATGLGEEQILNLAKIDSETGGVKLS